MGVGGWARKHTTPHQVPPRAQGDIAAEDPRHARSHQLSRPQKHPPPRRARKSRSSSLCAGGEAPVDDQVATSSSRAPCKSRARGRGERRALHSSPGGVVRESLLPNGTGPPRRRSRGCALRSRLRALMSRRSAAAPHTCGHGACMPRVYACTVFRG